MCIFLFWSADVIFNTLTKIHEKKIEKKDKYKMQITYEDAKED